MMLQKLMMVATCAVGCMALALDTAAAKPAPGPLQGRTAQKRAIRLALRPDSIQLKRFTIQLRCRDGSILVDDESGFLPTPLRAGGRIRDHQVGNTDDVWIKGRLRGRVLRGAIRVHDRVGRVRCDSGWVRFHAGRRGS